METELIVRNLPLSVDRHQVRRLFERYGEVTEVTLANHDTSLWAVVVLPNRWDALRAIDGLHGTRLADHILEVRLWLEDGLGMPGNVIIHGVRACELRVSNLPGQTTRDQLRALFKRYPVARIRMRLRQAEAFVQVAVGDVGLADAIRELDGSEFHGQPIKVEYVEGSATVLAPKAKPSRKNGRPTQSGQ